MGDNTLDVWEQFFRLLGQAINTPSLSCDIALGRFMAEHHERFVNMVENLPMTIGQHIKLQEFEDKYINVETSEAAGRHTGNGHP